MPLKMLNFFSSFKKSSLCDWQRARVGYILFVAFFFTGKFLFSVEAPTSSSVALQEAKVARESAEKRIVELELELSKVQQELERVRSRYADFYLESHLTVERLRSLELQASHLLRHQSELDDQHLASEALETLQLASTRQLEVYDAVQELEKYLVSILEVLQPSDALRQDVLERTGALNKLVESSLKPLSLVARRGSGGSGRHGCSVLAVNEKLQLIVLDCGFLAGLKAGSTWRLTASDGTLTARLRVVEVRPEISAAVVIQGAMEKLTPGCQLSAE